VLAGLLEPVVESVNMVNAPVVAQDRDISVSDVRHDRPGDYQTLMRVTVTTENRKRDVAGTLFANGRPRLVQVKGINIEAEVTPHMLYITNRDVPGIIGFLGQTLGDAGVNIATFNLGRAEAGGDAIALISVDQNLPPKVLAKIRGHEGINQAESLKF
jgi:D-3-phosphoglycerate dehydrogenase